MNNKLNFSDILDRIKQHEGTRNDKDVAKLFNVSAENLSRWKTRNRIPFEELLEYSMNSDVNFNWLLFGTHAFPEKSFQSKEVFIDEIIENLERLPEQHVRKYWHMICADLITIEDTSMS